MHAELTSEVARKSTSFAQLVIGLKATGELLAPARTPRALSDRSYRFFAVPMVVSVSEIVGPGHCSGCDGDRCSNRRSTAIPDDPFRCKHLGPD